MEGTVLILVRDHILVRIPAAEERKSPQHTWQWLREHGFPDLAMDEWRIYYGELLDEPPGISSAGKASNP
ncbi:protein of unknown function [Candidatus Hydrogenisulfobacillus filiaventi]|uniref:Uncharacterized protein n=1 Tax=Candidatus Hydrogenisulfobacillus filiaventi TaxID=2707344 RepID=A0A6F8ZHF1_9FIRM|nr:protein of unknown function [Candidatus Hydrogenisulfobacillus filiaventi]